MARNKADTGNRGRRDRDEGPRQQGATRQSGSMGEPGRQEREQDRARQSEQAHRGTRQSDMGDIGSSGQPGSSHSDVGRPEKGSTSREEPRDLDEREFDEQDELDRPL